MTRLRAATYNVHKCRGMDWRTSVPRVSKVMKELAADLIAVQEVFAEQVECLERGLEMRSVFGEVRKLNGQGYGNAVFSRLPIVEWEQYDLTVGGPRAAPVPAGVCGAARSAALLRGTPGHFVFRAAAAGGAAVVAGDAGEA